MQIIGRATRDAVGKTRARFTNLIAEPDAGEQAVTEAVNDTLKAIAASLLMEQVLAPRFEFRPKTNANSPNRASGPLPGLDYGPVGYDQGGCNVGVNGTTGGVEIEINGLAIPESDEATRICREDLNEVVASFVQDTRTVQDGLFNDELPPQETTQQRMGKIIRDKYPDLSNQDQEATCSLSMDKKLWLLTLASGLLPNTVSEIGVYVSYLIDDCASGAIYVARSLSDHPFIKENVETASLRQRGK